MHLHLKNSNLNMTVWTMSKRRDSFKQVEVCLLKLLMLIASSSINSKALLKYNVGVEKFLSHYMTKVCLWKDQMAHPSKGLKTGLEFTSSWVWQNPSGRAQTEIQRLLLACSSWTLKIAGWMRLKSMLEVTLFLRELEAKKTPPL